MRPDEGGCYDNANEKEYLRCYPNRGEVTGRSAISEALWRQISQRGYLCSASLTLKHITPPPSPHPSTVPRFNGLYHFRCGVASRNDARFRPIGFIRDDSEWKGELLIRGQDCGNGHELPRVVARIRPLLTKQLPLS